MASEENECQALWTLSLLLLSTQEPLLLLLLPHFQSLLGLAEAINCACQCLNGAAVPNLCHNQQRAVNVGQSAQSQSDSQSVTIPGHSPHPSGCPVAGSETKSKGKAKEKQR